MGFSRWFTETSIKFYFLSTLFVRDCMKYNFTFRHPVRQNPLELNFDGPYYFLTLRNLVEFDFGPISVMHLATAKWKYECSESSSS
jgi:hypothetical protein